MANLASGLQWAETAVITYPIQIFTLEKISKLNLFCCNWICCANNWGIYGNSKMSVLCNVLFLTGLYRAVLVCNGLYWALLVITGFYLALLGTTGLY